MAKVWPLLGEAFCASLYDRDNLLDRLRCKAIRVDSGIEHASAMLKVWVAK